MSAERAPDPMTQPERSCVVCRTPRPTSELVRLALVGGRVAPAESGGRGAWVCVAYSCLSGLTARSLSRALEAPVPHFDGGQLVTHLHALAEKRVLEAIGLARRSGSLVAGVEAAGSQSDGFLLISDDLSDRSRRRLEDGAQFVGQEALGAAAGMGATGAMRLTPGRLAQRAAYWHAIWRESGPRDRRGTAARSEDV